MGELDFDTSLLVSMGSNKSLFVGNTFIGDYIDVMVLYDMVGEVVAINADESRLIN